MIARLVRMRVRPEDIAEVVERYNDVIVPVAQEEEGFLGALLLTRPDGTIVSVDLCASAEQARSNERHGIYQQEVARFRDRLVDHRPGSSTTSPPRSVSAEGQTSCRRTPVEA